LKKRDLSSSKIDEIKTKVNILRSFVKEKVEEGKEKVGRSESEL
jgi:hypothetical protein